MICIQRSISFNFHNKYPKTSTKISLKLHIPWHCIVLSSHAWIVPQRIHIWIMLWLFIAGGHLLNQPRMKSINIYNLRKLTQLAAFNAWNLNVLKQKIYYLVRWNNLAQWDWHFLSEKCNYYTPGALWIYHIRTRLLFTERSHNRKSRRLFHSVGGGRHLQTNSCVVWDLNSDILTFNSFCHKLVDQQFNSSRTPGERWKNNDLRNNLGIAQSDCLPESKRRTGIRRWSTIQALFYSMKRMPPWYLATTLAILIAHAFRDSTSQ